MLSYPVQAAKESGLFDSVIVSTEDFEISSIANKLGALVLLREPELAKDEIGTQEVMRYVLTVNPALSKYDYACCIYPCTPMMTAQDLKRGYDALIGWHYAAAHNYAFAVGTDPLCDAGQFYWGHAKNFRDGVPLVSVDSAIIPIAPERVCDINTPEDFSRAEKMYRALHPEVA